MIFDLINLDKLRRGIIYAGILLLVLFFQTTLCARIAPLGVHAILLPIAVCAVGLFEGGVWGCVFGLFTGLLADRIFAETLVLYTLLMPALGFGAGLLAEYYVNRRFFSFFFVCIAALLITAFCQMFRLLVFSGADVLPLVRTALLQTLWSLPFTPVLYFPCRALARRNLARKDNLWTD
jgi:cell shape-determining protein MreD